MAYTKTTWVNGNPPAINATNLNHIEQGIEDAHNSIDGMRTMIGSPLVANTVADMTDTNKIYVYVGSETGYVNGDWYYYDTVATTPQWVSGGVYNAVAVNCYVEGDTLYIGSAVDANEVSY